MSRIEISARELFLRLGATPSARSARADRLFRRLRSEDGQAIVDTIMGRPARIEAPRTDAPRIDAPAHPEQDMRAED